MKAPALLTPADWHGYLVGLAVEAYDRVHERGEPGSLNDVRRERFLVEVRERMAQASMVVTCELDLAREAAGERLSAARERDEARKQGAAAMRAEAARRLRNIYTRARLSTTAAEASGIVEAITAEEALRSEADRVARGPR